MLIVELDIFLFYTTFVTFNRGDRDESFVVSPLFAFAFDLSALTAALDVRGTTAIGTDVSILALLVTVLAETQVVSPARVGGFGLGSTVSLFLTTWVAGVRDRGGS